MKVALVSTFTTGFATGLLVLPEEDLPAGRYVPPPQSDVLTLPISFLAAASAASLSIISIFLLSTSYALSGSIVWLYLRTRSDDLFIEAISSGVKISILLIGALSMVAASGVGIPFSLRAVTRASPMPSAVIVSSVL